MHNEDTPYFYASFNGGGIGSKVFASKFSCPEPVHVTLSVIGHCINVFLRCSSSLKEPHHSLIFLVSSKFNMDGLVNLAFNLLHELSHIGIDKVTQDRVSL